MALPVSSTRTAFLNAAKERILVLDGAMGDRKSTRLNSSH